MGSTKLQPPMPWEKWRSQLKMALVAKTNVELDELLREKPTTVIYPPEPVEEQPVNNPTQTMERERLTRYSQAVAKWKNECNLIDRIGVLFAETNHGMRQTERKINGLSNHWNRGTPDAHPKVPPRKRREHHDTTTVGRIGVDISRPRNVTFDRYLLLTRRQQKGETMEQFHSALSSLAEFCQLGALEDDLLRDIFTANMTDPEIQKGNTRPREGTGISH